MCSKEIRHFDQERELSDVTDCHVLRHVSNVVNVCAKHFDEGERLVTLCVMFPLLSMCAESG